MITLRRTTFLIAMIKPGMRHCTSVMSCLIVYICIRHSDWFTWRISEEKVKEISQKRVGGTRKLMKSWMICVLFRERRNGRTSPGPEKWTAVLEGRPGSTKLCTRTPSSPNTWPLAFFRLFNNCNLLRSWKTNGQENDIGVSMSQSLPSHQLTSLLCYRADRGSRDYSLFGLHLPMADPVRPKMMRCFMLEKLSDRMLKLESSSKRWGHLTLELALDSTISTLL